MEEYTILEELTPEDKEKVFYFAKILLKQEKYRKLKREIEERKKEIEKGEILSHEDIWGKLGV